MIVPMRAFLYSTASLAGLLLTGCSGSAPEPAKASPAVQVKIGRVSQGDATRSIMLPADILPYQQATLYAKVGGYLKTVVVDKGDFVKEGLVLADIEVPELIADRAKDKAELDVVALELKRISEAQQKAPDLV